MDHGRGSGGVDEPPGIAQPEGEPVLADAATRAAAAQQAPPASTKPDHDDVGGKVKHRWYAVLLIALIGGVVAVVVLASSSSTQTGKLSSSALAPVPTNHVTGSGSATVRLSGDVAAVTVTTNGLDDDAALVHAMHIHAGAKGECPPASAARLHNGHLTISTTDGINYYGPPVLALTTRGDTSPASILTFPRFLTGGTLHYSRTITLPASVAADIRRNNAVVVVHGIDYDGTGIYSGVLERSELNKSLPATATAPALCGRLIGSQQVAGLRPRSRGHALVYSASLTVNTASALTEAFLCHVGEGGAVEGEVRRSASTRATA